MRKIVTYFYIVFYKFLILALHLFIEQGIAEQTDLLSSLTLEEKIGQLFIIPVCQLRGKDHFDDVQTLISDRKIGGVILKQGTVEGQKIFINQLQSISQLPLLCIQDGEWGVGVHLSDAISFARNLTLGAVQDLSLLYSLEYLFLAKSP